MGKLFQFSDNKIVNPKYHFHGPSPKVYCWFNCFFCFFVYFRQRQPAFLPSLNSAVRELSRPASTKRLKHFVIAAPSRNPGEIRRQVNLNKLIIEINFLPLTPGWLVTAPATLRLRSDCPITAFLAIFEKNFGLF